MILQEENELCQRLAELQGKVKVLRAQVYPEGSSEGMAGKFEWLKNINRRDNV